MKTKTAFFLKALLVIGIVFFTNSCEYLFNSPFPNTIGLEVDSIDISQYLEGDYDQDNVRFRVLTAEKGSREAFYTEDTVFIVILIENRILLVFNDKLDLILKEDTTGIDPLVRDFTGRLICYNPYTNYFYIGRSQFFNDWKYYQFNRLPAGGESGVFHMDPDGEAASILSQTITLSPDFSTDCVAVTMDYTAAVSTIIATQSDNPPSTTQVSRVLPIDGLEFITIRSYKDDVMLFYRTPENSIYVEHILSNISQDAPNLISTNSNMTSFYLDQTYGEYKPDDFFVINDTIYVREYEMYRAFDINGNKKPENDMWIGNYTRIAVQDNNDGQVMSSDATATYTYLKKHNYFYTYNTRTKKLAKNNLWF